jgi:hypothetical protein
LTSTTASTRRPVARCALPLLVVSPPFPTRPWRLATRFVKIYIYLMHCLLACFLRTTHFRAHLPVSSLGGVVWLATRRSASLRICVKPHLPGGLLRRHPPPFSSKQTSLST